MRIYSGTFILSLFYCIQIGEDNFEVFFILIKERGFDSLRNFIHFFETYFFLLFVQTIFIQILNQVTSIFDIKINLFVMFFSLIRYCDFVWNTDPFKMFYEITEVNIPRYKISLRVQASQILCLWICMNPHKRNWCAICFKNQSI